MKIKEFVEKLKETENEVYLHSEEYKKAFKIAGVDVFEWLDYSRHKEEIRTFFLHDGTKIRIYYQENNIHGGLVCAVVCNEELISVPMLYNMSVSIISDERHKELLKIIENL